MPMWCRKPCKILRVTITYHRTVYRKLSILQRVLRAYAGKLIGRLPKTASGSVNATASAGTTDWQIKMPDDDIPVVCTIVSTAEYCNEIVGSLGRSVAKMLDQPFGEQVQLHLSLASLV